MEGKRTQGRGRKKEIKESKKKERKKETKRRDREN